MKEKLSELLSKRQKRRIVNSGRIPSAVLVPLYHKDGQYHVLLTKRTDRVETHKGQISFPGGGFHPQDGTLLETALRECHEEIGLPREKVDVLGELDDFDTVVSNFIISPFVGFIPWPCEFKLNPFETEALVEVPLLSLLDSTCRMEKIKLINNKTVTSYAYIYQDKIIWGATAGILGQFLDIVRYL